MASPASPAAPVTLTPTVKREKYKAEYLAGKPPYLRWPDAEKFALTRNIDPFNASEEWFDNFKKRYRLVEESGDKQDGRYVSNMPADVPFSDNLAIDSHVIVAGPVTDSDIIAEILEDSKGLTKT
ncbi:hypothetical protein HPB51_012692 [Rhipicephalus microplus]|uniref:HTH CENPB-type domain-containing protein n=1 Tax=Rhipicephalus microplus TaxID=6941 RepID=A0A9J6D587_RHIMP|nr:hypothetical protein HPB51_012692 [Rhipicephalus microplus]